MKNKDYLKIENKFKYLIFLIIYFAIYPFCKLLYGRKRNWLICERGDDAQDNGFRFYEYLIENHPEIKPVYLIKKNSKDYEKVCHIGKTVEFGTFKHLLMCIGYPVKISSHLFGYAPWVQLALYYRRHKTNDKHIFLQHGITKNTHEGLYGDVCKSLDLFVCGAKPEYMAIKNTFHFDSDVPKYTGFARYDKLVDICTNNQLLFMPTWRVNLSGLSEEEFFKADFYREWSNLLNSSALIAICKKNGLIIKFYLHYMLQPYSHLFESNEVVKVIKFGQEEVQTLLKESKLLVTDFSSVFFDFAYMKKPVLYFQFDEGTFYDEHYKKGYFDYRDNGFGPVYLETNELVKHIIFYIESNFAIEPRFKERMESFFELRDQHNCDRIYDAIMAIK